MDKFAESIVEHVKGHRCYSHPLFENWAKVGPGPEVVGALFHQIQNFCASTRPGLNFPEALKKNGLADQSALMQEIVESEANHGPELATMAGHIVNRAANSIVFKDLYDQQAVEGKLKQFSDSLLGSLPGYDAETGLTTQAREAIAVFERRVLVDKDATYRNLGTALALEMISNRQLIPGEKHALVDSGVYKANLNEAEMHYLLEHWGEVGAEQQHEKNAIEAVGLVADERAQRLIKEGADDFLNSLTALWDLLDTSLLQSGYGRRLAA
jgi:hypothetical protein